MMPVNARFAAVRVHRSIGALLYLLLAAAVLPRNAASAETAADWPRLLVVYGEPNAQEQAFMIANLAGHFRLRTETLGLEDTHPDQLRSADYVIFISAASSALRRSASGLFASLHIPVLWIGEPPGEIFDHNALAAVHYHYRDKVYTETSSLVFPLPPEAGNPPWTVLAEASDGAKTVPLLAASGSRWHFLTRQLYGVPGKILEDALHDFLGQFHEEDHEGFVRIEDVHPFVEPERLREIADLLSSRHLPYMVAVIPVFVNPKSGEQVQMGQKPEFVEALRYMADHGATILMHGYTHQYRTSETGEGFEFWDSVQDAPIEDEQSYTADKLERGFATMVYNGIVPVAFEPPHYTMSQAGYAQLSQYFSTLVAQLQVSDRTYHMTQQPPYRLHSDRHGLRVIPETVGFVLDEPGYPERMRVEIDRTLLVRDSVIGAFYHPYLPVEKLEGLLDVLGEYPLDYIDLKSEENRVSSDFADIRTGWQGVQVVVKDPEKLERLGAPPAVETSWLSNVTYWVTWAIAAIVMTFLAIFALLLIRLNRKKRAAIFVESEANGR